MIRPARFGVLAVALLGGLAAAAAPAAAHEVDPSVITLIDSVTPEFEGITVEVGTSVTTQLLASNETDELLEVLAETGEPFLRIGPDGVEANLASPSWYVTNQPFGADQPPEGADPDAPPRWARVSAERSWGWFDHRLHPTNLLGGLGEEARPTFVVPMRLGGEDLVVRGHLEQRTQAPVFSSGLRAVPDAATGLVVQLLQGRAPGLFVRYDGAAEVVVEGADGEPFLRLGPAGAEVNQHSPTWLFTAQARGEDLSGIDADPGEEPSWVAVSPQPSFAWLDPRALIPTASDEPIQLDWAIPVVIDGRPVEILGSSFATVVAFADVAGVQDDDDRTWAVRLVVASLAVTLATTAWLLIARRRSTGNTTPG